MLILVFQLPFEISDPNLAGFTSSVQTGKHIDPGFGNKILSCQTLNQLKLTWESKKKVATEVSRNSDWKWLKQVGIMYLTLVWSKAVIGVGLPTQAPVVLSLRVGVSLCIS